MKRALALLTLVASLVVALILWRARPNESTASATPDAPAVSSARRAAPDAASALPDALELGAGASSDERTMRAPVPLERRATRSVGRIVAADGRGLPGVRALAWWSGAPPRLAEVERAVRDEHPQFFTAVSGPDGRVEFAGFDPLRDYTVTAGGAGWLAIQPAAGWRAGGEGREVTVEPWYALHFDLRRADGTPYVVPRGFAEWPFEIELPNETTWSELPRALELRLAGVDPDEIREPMNVWFRSTDDLRALGPFALYLAPPGLVPIERTDLSVPRLGAPLAKLEVRGVEQPTASEVVVRFEQPGTHAEAAPPRGRVRFFGLDGRLRFELECGPQSGRPLKLEAVPQGDYHVRFEGVAPGLVIPPPESSALLAHVGGEPRELVLVLPECGGIVIEIRELDESPYAGRVTLRFTREDAGASEVYFERAPYTLDSVPVGSYGVEVVGFAAPVGKERTLDVEDSRGFVGPSEANVQVRAGAASELVLRPWRR